MKFDRKIKNCGGIYKITNSVNSKVYIGKTKNFYKRYYQYRYDFFNKRINHINQYLFNSMNKYGFENFKMEVVEILTLDEKLYKNRELYWIKHYNSTNRNSGYNLRMDSSTNMIVHKETSEKISRRLKKEWKSGIRDEHSQKLKDSWKNDINRKLKQSKLMSKTLTKYVYKLLDENKNFIKYCKYKDLVGMNLQNCVGSFHREKSNFIKYKNYYVNRIQIKDIVQT